MPITSTLLRSHLLLLRRDPVRPGGPFRPLVGGPARESSRCLMKRFAGPAGVQGSRSPARRGSSSRVPGVDEKDSLISVEIIFLVCEVEEGGGG